MAVLTLIARLRGPAEAGTGPLRGVGEERELRDDEGGPAGVEQAPLEAVPLVGEDAQPRDLAGQPVGHRLAVAARHPEQDAESGADLPHDLALDPHARSADALAHGSHPRPGLYSNSRIRVRYWFESGRSELASL